MPPTKTEKDTPEKEISYDFQIKTYEQAMNNIRSFITVAVQVLSALAIANITVIGFAFANQRAVTFLLGATLMFVALIMHRSLRKWMMPYVYTVIATEKLLFKNDNDPTLMFASLLNSEPGFYEKVLAITECKDLEERQKKLTKLALPRLFPNHMGIYAFTWIGMMGQLILIPILLSLGWQFM